MEKKEFKVGETFTAGLVRLKCVEPTAPDAGCEGCIFDYFTCGAVGVVAGPCSHEEREDNRDVIFIKAD
nr:MAG TPA_asm: hypothetical protein [Bacteriophage sp.]